MVVQHEYFATAPKNMERLLARELKELGAREVQHTVAGVHFKGPLAVGYGAVMWTRLANSVLLRLKSFPAATPEELYEGVRRIPWDEHLSMDSTFAVTFTTAQSQITHTKYGALKVKDAVVDQFRDAFDKRPSVELDRPDLRINCHVLRDEATLSIDLSGDSLHRRTYRQDSGKAPLKENVAAAVLLRAKWPEISKEGGPLFDPMCGSGTLLIEGALMAGDHAPGLLRDYFGFLGWLQHDPKVWEKVVAEAEKRKEAGMKNLGKYMGSDINARVLSTARKNAEAAGLGGVIHFERRAIRDIEPPPGSKKPGLLVTNAPYGERLGDDEEAVELHAELGRVLKERFPGWRVSVLTGSKELGHKLRLRADKLYKLFNGSLECTLVNLKIRDQKPSPTNPQ